MSYSEPSNPLHGMYCPFVSIGIRMLQQTSKKCWVKSGPLTLRNVFDEVKLMYITIVQICAAEIKLA